jgi:hypothetical protein
MIRWQMELHCLSALHIKRFQLYFWSYNSVAQIRELLRVQVLTSNLKPRYMYKRYQSSAQSILNVLILVV